MGLGSRAGLQSSARQRLGSIRWNGEAFGSVRFHVRNRGFLTPQSSIRWALASPVLISYIPYVPLKWSGLRSRYISKLLEALTQQVGWERRVFFVFLNLSFSVKFWSVCYRFTSTFIGFGLPFHYGSANQNQRRKYEHNRDISKMKQRQQLLCSRSQIEHRNRMLFPKSWQVFGTIATTNLRNCCLQALWDSTNHSCAPLTIKLIIKNSLFRL